MQTNPRPGSVAARTRIHAALRRRPVHLVASSVLAGLLLPFVGTATPAAADDPVFPYETDFSSADGGDLSGHGRILDGGGLRLTDDQGGQAGAWTMGDAFPSTAGLEIEFAYRTTHDHDSPTADGLALTLADGAAEPGVGAYGASLGYACRSDSNQGSGPCTLPGMPGGFAAIALDQYGNFSLPINDSGPGNTPGSVVVRGSGDGTDGYRFVAGAAAPGGIDTDGAVRTVRVTLVPVDGHVLATVRLSDGGVMRTVLTDVPLDGGGQAALPATLRLGFSASTGSNFSAHDVTGLRVRQPADLRIEHEMPAATAVAGDPLTYRVVASNVGVNASDPSPVTVDVPDELQDVSWTCTPDGSASCGTASGVGDVDTTVGLDRGDRAVYTISGTVRPDTTTDELASTAAIATAPSLADIALGDNRSVASAPVTTSAVLTTGKAVEPVDGATTVAPGDEVEYTVTARNGGPSTARTVGAFDDLPEQLAFASSDDDCTAQGRLVTCRSDVDLAPGTEHAFRFRATLDPGYVGDGSDVVNVAVATSPTDPDDGDPSDPVTLTVVDPDDGGGTGGGHTGGGGGDGDGDGGDGDGARPGTTTPVDHARPTTTPRAGALAYTGTQGVGLVGGAAAALAVAGLVARRLARRHAASTADEAPEGIEVFERV